MRGRTGRVLRGSSEVVRGRVVEAGRSVVRRTCWESWSTRGVGRTEGAERSGSENRTCEGLGELIGPFGSVGRLTVEAERSVEKRTCRDACGGGFLREDERAIGALCNPRHQGVREANASLKRRSA